MSKTTMLTKFVVVPTAATLSDVLNQPIKHESLESAKAEARILTATGEKYVVVPIDIEFHEPIDPEQERNMTTPIRTDTPLEPIDFRDRAYFAPCLKRRRSNNRAGRLTDEQVLEIRHRYATEPISQDALANQYGVHRITVNQILLHITWAGLEDVA